METSDFLAPVDDNFLCTICQNVMVSPRACSQGHQFCCDCISMWLQQSQKCPQRCGDLAIGSLTKIRGIENQINKLQVRCCHSGVSDGPSPGPKNLRHRSRANVASSEGGPDGGCGWVGTVEDRARHLRDECAYSEVACSCEGCDAKVQRFELAEHERSCEHREVSCEKCEKRVKAGEVGDHLLGCARVEIECPQECGARVLRGELGEHEKECANVVVSCSFAEHGCEKRGKRKKVQEHEEEAAVAHSRLAARQAEFFKQALAEKTSQVQKLEEELAASLSGGVAPVRWEIEDFTAKAKKKVFFISKVFHVPTKAGAYHLRLSVDFTRKAGSTRRGYVALFVRHDSANGGSANFPVSLEGTELTVAKGARKTTKKFGQGDQLERDAGLGWGSMLSTDKLPGLRWTDEDEEEEAEEGEEPEYDVTDLLENDTLTVKGTIRVTPPKEIDI